MTTRSTRSRFVPSAQAPQNNSKISKWQLNKLIEIKLTANGLQVVDTVDGKRTVRPVKDFPKFADFTQIEQQLSQQCEEREINMKLIQELNNQINNHDGFISLLKSEYLQSNHNEQPQAPGKIKFLICLTSYNETRKQFEDSIQGILNNMPYFKRAGISNDQIAVVAIFDGIDKLNNGKIDGETDINESILEMFKDINRENGFNTKDKEKQTMNYQAEEFCKQLENSKKKVVFNNKQIEKNNQNHPKPQRPDNPLLPHNNNQNQQQQIIQQQVPQENMFAYQRPSSLQNFTGQFLQNVSEEAIKNRQKQIQLEKDQKDWYYGQQYVNQRSNCAYLVQVRQWLNDTENDVLNEQNEQYQPIQNEDKDVFLQIFYCVKFHNARKLNSHLWFFKGFCQLFNPEYCCLIDCGLEPGKDSLWKFFAAMEADKNVGGVCGNMNVRPESITDDYGRYKDELESDNVGDLSKICHRYFNIQKAQMFEYHFAHIIDKAFESIFGFIHVLPGAFSAYRWKAISDHTINQYLETQLDPNFQFMDLETANKFLAEDRILCLGIFSKPDCEFTLKYLPNAYAQVDSMISLKAILGQRKRWINGTWFALNYVVSNCGQVAKSNHGCCRKFFFYLSIGFARFNQCTTYIMIGLYFSLLYITLYDFLRFRDFNISGQSFNLFQALIFSYIMMVGVLIFCSLNFQANNKIATPIFYLISTFLGLYVIFSYVLMIYSVIDVILADNDERGLSGHVSVGILQALIYITIGGNAIPVLFQVNKVYEILGSLIHYIFYSPTYMHLFLIYAFSRIDDLSWGTKGVNSADEKKVNVFSFGLSIDELYERITTQGKIHLLKDKKSLDELIKQVEKARTQEEKQTLRQIMIKAFQEECLGLKNQFCPICKQFFMQINQKSFTELGTITYDQIKIKELTLTTELQETFHKVLEKILKVQKSANKTFDYNFWKREENIPDFGDTYIDQQIQNFMIQNINSQQRNSRIELAGSMSNIMQNWQLPQFVQKINVDGKQEREKIQLQMKVSSLSKTIQGHQDECAKAVFQQTKVIFLLLWILINAIFAFVFVSMMKNGWSKDIFITFVACLACFYTVVRSIGAIIYYFKYYLWDYTFFFFSSPNTITGIAKNKKRIQKYTNQSLALQKSLWNDINKFDERLRKLQNPQNK